MMQFLALVALLASAVSATSTAAAPAAAGTSTCAAQNILDACLQTENNLFNSCGTNDWNCKCNAYKDIVTCYNNCPNDPAVYSAQGQVQIFCGYASQYPSTTTAVAAKTGGTVTTPTSTMAPGTKGTTTASVGSMTTGGTAGTTTGTAAAATVTDSGASPLLQSGSILVTFVGIIAALL
ncbi:hypothetical protein SEPCBS119000_004977 [Sporothrix epigloea]|uniref:GPI anchored serine-threonineeeee rich protein n=1 Tax=Sporothrix epigloea TaxID=1892477 RepID=A0ABP0DWY9_9PEZI